MHCGDHHGRGERRRRAQSNGLIERFYLILLDEHLRYETVEEMQKDLDVYF